MTISPTTVRANGSSLRGYLAVFKGTLVLTATVTSDAETVNAKSLDISITFGAIMNVIRGYRVQFFASDGTTFKGESHVRWGNTLDATHLPVREFSESEFLILTGDVVKVYALMAFADKLVEDTSDFDPDGVPTGTYNSFPPPLACSGGYDAGFVDGYETGTVLTYRTVTTNGAPSMILDPNSTPGNLAHVWTLPAGCSFAPGSLNTDPSPTLRIPQGEYTVSHAVQDVDNSQVWTQSIVYIVFDATHQPVPVLMESAPTGAADQGWSCTFRALTFLNLTDAPDGSLVMFFVRERINGTWQSLGGTVGRSAVKLVGYLSHDESDLTQQLQYQRFEVISPLQRLSQLPGFSKVLMTHEAPDDWAEMLALTTLRAIVQLLRIYTFVLDGGHDLLVSSFYTNLDYPELWLQKESPRQQVDELADGTDARLSCTRTGLFRLDPQPSLLAPATRAGLTTVYTFAQRDVVRLVARRSHFDTVETLELHATSATGSGSVADVTAVFSRAPGSPGHGAEFITIERIIADPADPQGDANARAGRRYGMRNGVYTDSATGVKARAPEIDVEMRQVYDFLDFDDTMVRFGAFPNPRDIDLTAFDWQLIRVQLDYSSGKVISTFAPLTDSPAGATYVPPTAELPPYTPPGLVPQPVIPLPNPIPPWSGALPQTLLSCAYSTAQFAITTVDWNAQTATHEEHSTGLTTAGIFFCTDPWNSKSVWMICQDGLYNCADWKARAAWTLVKTNAALFGNAAARGHWVGMSINRPGFIIVASGVNALAVSYDYLATVALVAADGGAATYGTDPESVFNVSVALYPYSSVGNSKIQAFVDNGSNGRSLFQSTDWAAVFTSLYPNWTSGASHGGEWHYLYRQPGGAANTPNRETYASTRGGAPPFTSEIFLSDSDSGYALAVVLFDSGSAVGNAFFAIPRPDGCGVIPFTWDADIIFCAAVSGAGNGGIMWTGDSFVTTPVFNLLSNSAGSLCGMNSFPTNETVFNFFAYAGSGGLLVGQVDSGGAAAFFDATPTFYSDFYVRHSEFSLIIDS